MSERWQAIGDRICIEYLKHPLLYRLLGLTAMAAVAALAGAAPEVHAQEANCGQGWELESVAQLGQGAQALVMEVPVGPARYGVFDNLWCAVEQARQLGIKLPNADDGAMITQITDGLRSSFSRQIERVLAVDGNGTLFVRSARELSKTVGDQVTVLLPLKSAAQPIIETAPAATVTGANGLVEFPPWVKELETASYYISGGLIGVSALIFGAMRLMMGPTIPQSSARPSSSPAPRTYVSPEDRVEQEALRDWHQRNEDHRQQSEKDEEAYVGRLIANGWPRDKAESEFYRVSQGMPARDSLDGGVPGGGASGINASDSLFEALQQLEGDSDKPLGENPDQSGGGKSDIKPRHPGSWIEGDYQVRDVDSPPDAGDEG